MKQWPVRGLLMGGMVLALGGIPAGPACADAIIDNVSGYTIDAKGQMHPFGAVILSPDGKVVQLLGPKDKRPKKLDWRYDGQGRTMLPGLIDAHAHVMAVGIQGTQVDISGAKSLAEAQAMIRDYAAAHPEKRWILGRGWNQETWGLSRFPTATELDAAVADRPVWLIRVDGHAGWANNAALRQAGLDRAAPTVAGGQIDQINGRPAGVLVNGAMALMQPFVPALLPVELDQAAAMAQHQLLGKGITTVTDMGTSQTDWNSLRRLGDAGRLQMRVIAYADDIDTLLAVAGPKKTPWLYGDRLRMVGVNIGLDGALGSRGGWLKQSYADAPGNTGLRLVADTRLRNIYSRASMDGFQVAIDAIGDAANAEALDVIDEMAPTYTGDRRWRIEHAQVIDPADLPRFGRNGIIASMQPVHEVSDRAMVSARLGQARLSGAYAWQSIAKAGGRLAFGSDTPVEPADMMPGFAAALGRDGPERLTPAQTLAGFTSGAAYAGFADDRIGRLLPGYHADFVLLDGDPMTLPPNVVRSIKVLETWIDGKRVWSKAPGGK